MPAKTSAPLPTPARIDAPRRRILGTTRLFFMAPLVILLVLCLAFSWITRGTMAQLAYLRAQSRSGANSIVSTSPWQTAQSLASTAGTFQEARYASEAEHLADHEVDQAFAAALRSADLQMHRRVLTGRALALSQRVAQLKQVIAQDKITAQQLSGQSAPSANTAKNAANSAAGTDAAKVAEAQLGLDTDQLNDAQSALDRATGNLTVRIKDELAAHEASMSKYESEQASGTPLALNHVKNPGTLAGRFHIWLNLRSRYAALQQARSAAQNDVHILTTQYNQLEAATNASASSFARGTATLAEIQDRRAQRQILSIDQDRIQTSQQLVLVYAKWGDQVVLQRSIILHLVLQSFEVILAVILCMILADALIRRLMSHPSLDRRHTQTLRTILEVSAQAVGILIIALIIFGPPHQTGTILGLITAGLAIALQDYILSFLGWFMLAGKNGIHVGDMVEINSICGEVVKIGLISTTLLETTGLAEKGEPTGRSISFFNSFAIRGTHFNFSSDGQWLWDEITITVPASEDVYALAKSVEECARLETAESARLAEQEWNRKLPSTGLNRVSAAPIVTMRPSSSNVDLQVRYVTRAVGRFEVRDRLYMHVIEMLREKKQLAATPALP